MDRRDKSGINNDRYGNDAGTSRIVPQDPGEKTVTSCPYCGKSNSSLFFIAHDRNRHISSAVFPYYRCVTCGLIFLEPVPPDLGAYYPQDYYPVPSCSSELVSASENERFKLDLILPFIQQGKLLEVGPAFGNFAYLAKRSGFDVEVIEMDSRCCEVLRNVAGIETIQSSDAAHAVQDKGPYDVIALWHVIEHLPNFKQTLDVLASKVRKGGVLVMAAPNPESWQFRILGRYWTHVDAPRHVVLIPVELLVAHMRKFGFTAVSMTMTDPGGIGWNMFGWQYSLSNFAKSRFLKNALLRLGAVLTRIMAPFEVNDQAGSAYTVIFRKEH
jgi:2-polyprenyl-3-methyl-5-hydroxy-6-metoxy-1,4-benzoquinol methylase